MSSNKFNVFTAHANELLSGLAGVNHLLFIYHTTSTTAAKDAQAKLDAYKASGDPTPFGGFFGSTTTLAVADLKTNKYFYPVASLKHSDERLISLLEEVACRQRAHVLVMAFEIVERYLVQVVATLTFQLRGGHGGVSFDKTEFHRAQPRWNKSPQKGAPEYYKAYAQWLARKKQSLLLALVRAVPEFSQTATTNWLEIDLLEVYRAVAFCRHRIVHTDGRYSISAFRKLTARQREIVKDLSADVEEGTAEMRLLPSYSKVKSVLEYLGTFGFVAYHATTKQCAMKLDIAAPRRRRT